MNSLLSFLIEEIKKKKQISQIPDEFIEKHINSYFLRRGDIRKRAQLQELSSNNKIIKSIVKEIRKELGDIYGSYQTALHKKKQRYLEKNSINELLQCHKSTRERINHYSTIYSKIISWYHPIAIADVACGFNPISYWYLEKYFQTPPYYYVCDLNPDDMKAIETFFSNNSINGNAIAMDVTRKAFLKDTRFQRCDLIFLLKALDSFEKNKKNSSKQLLEELPQTKVVVSFSTQSLVAKKEVSIKKRSWFIKFIEQQQWNYETFEIDNEIFFLIDKDS